jgi:hypothetical protein
LSQVLASEQFAHVWTPRGNAVNTVKHGSIASGIPFAKAPVTRMEVLP